MEGTFPEGVVADGCKKKCEKDEILIVNVAKNSWDCVPKSFRKFSKNATLTHLCFNREKVEEKTIFAKNSFRCFCFAEKDLGFCHLSVLESSI